jgi:hypothetical protein
MDEYFIGTTDKKLAIFSTNPSSNNVSASSMITNGISSGVEISFSRFAARPGVEISISKSSGFI